MRAIAIKEIRELRRDRRTLAMLFLLPILFLVVFGYAASFDVQDVPTVVVGPQAALATSMLPSTLKVVDTDAAGDRAAAEDQLRRGKATVAVVTPSSAGGKLEVLIDGTELFAAQAAVRSLTELKAEAAAAQTGGAAARREPRCPRCRSTSSTTPACAPRSS